MNDLEYKVYGGSHIPKFEFLSSNGVIHMRLLCSARNRGDSVHLGNLKQCLGGGASLSAGDCVDALVGQEVRRAG